MKTTLSLLVLLAMGVRTSAANVAYPVKIDPSHRYLVDQSNRPFFLQGDSPWSLAVQLTASQAATYFSNQAALGFNSMIANVVEHKFSDNPPYNVYGVLPFTNHVGATTNWDMSSVNPDYYTNLDAILNEAGKYGIQLLLDPDFVGKYCGGAGWCTDMRASGSNALYSYGQFLGDRYRSYTNIMWLNGGDNPFDQDLVNGLMNGIMSKDTNHLALCETDGEVQGFYYTGAWNTINTVYTWNFSSISPQTLSEYYTSAAPVILIEALYEGNPVGPHNTSDLECRNQAFWAVFGGACGHFYGKEPLWRLMPNWQTNLNSPGAVTMQFVQKLMNSRPWYACVPDTNHSAIISGYGVVGSPTYYPVLRHFSGYTVMGYITGQSGSSATVTADLSSVSGAQANCWWFNPRDGSVTNIGVFATNGTKDFTAPDAHDWVLVLDDASQNYGPPGTTQPVTPVGPNIAADLTNQTVVAGSNATLSVTAEGTGPLAYQWFFNGASLPGITSSSLVLSNVAPSDTGSYQVVITNAWGAAVSYVATLTVLVPNALSLQRVTGNLFLLTFTGMPGRTYTLQFTTNLNSSWQALGQATVGASGSFSFYAAGASADRFYRSSYP